jgi:hypothetical protein
MSLINFASKYKGKLICSPNNGISCLLTLAVKTLMNMIFNENITLLFLFIQKFNFIHRHSGNHWALQ